MVRYHHFFSLCLTIPFLFLLLFTFTFHSILPSTRSLLSSLSSSSQFATHFFCWSCSNSKRIIVFKIILECYSYQKECKEGKSFGILQLKIIMKTNKSGILDGQQWVKLSMVDIQRSNEMRITKRTPFSAMGTKRNLQNKKDINLTLRLT